MNIQTRCASPFSDCGMLCQYKNYLMQYNNIVHDFINSTCTQLQQ